MKRKAPPIHSVARIDEYRNFPQVFLLSCKTRVSPKTASFSSNMNAKTTMTSAPDEGSTQELKSPRWARDKQEALPVVGFKSGQPWTGGSIVLGGMKYLGGEKNTCLVRRHRAGKGQTLLVFFEILNGGIKASLSNKDISQQIPLRGLMGHTMNLSSLKAPPTPPTSIKFFGSMPETKFSFL